MAKLSLCNLRKSYGDTEILHGVSMEIEDGEFVVIVGPSGCGKSTLLRMVAGLEGITSGEIVIGDRVVNQLEPAHRDIAMVFQNYALYPHMTVRQNMSYGLKIRGMKAPLVKEKVDAVAESLGLTQLLERKPRQLSGGQRQRVAMGRAIVREPAVFLFDEPLSNLDAKLRVQMRLELGLLHRRLGTTSLYVTHDQVEAITLANRMMVLNAGVVEQIGTPAQVYGRPASMFVGGFIGSPPMNLIPAHRTGAGTLQVEAAQGEPETPLGRCGLEHLVPERFVLGVRPEHLEICPAAEALLQLKVRAVENLGADSFAYCGIDGRPVVVRLKSGEHRLEAGEMLGVRAAQENLHWFHAETGKRLELEEVAAEAR
ncbi:MAG: sn-glycerol-3-phosphate ABC transporter ATP-binding protein UgpC [Holophaga sp.]|nr:sn-glycerol-3-phosphate ABC transporter ATP-binding protein UgpC [Holophaga sp.]